MRHIVEFSRDLFRQVGTHRVRENMWIRERGAFEYWLEDLFWRTPSDWFQDRRRRSSLLWSESLEKRTYYFLEKRIKLPNRRTQAMSYIVHMVFFPYTSWKTRRREKSIRRNHWAKRVIFIFVLIKNKSTSGKYFVCLYCEDREVFRISLFRTLIVFFFRWK